MCNIIYYSYWYELFDNASYTIVKQYISEISESEYKTKKLRYGE